MSEQSDAQFLRSIADRYSVSVGHPTINVQSLTIQEFWRLGEIAERLEKTENLVVVTGDPLRHLEAAPDAGTVARKADPLARETLDKEEGERWLNLFMTRNDRDLVAEVRGLLRQAAAAGYRHLHSGLSDRQIAEDLCRVEKALAPAEPWLVTIAVAKVRADQTGVAS